ncbi:MAG: DUF4342 domain-containing protein [Chloroflexi bacterium]|nr:DUF4342 domain-containing protein [Chloroflexota bacterium]MBP8055322.1 DUF4342 domain-containing protein [Chloroflexota bacterium]
MNEENFQEESYKAETNHEEQVTWTEEFKVAGQDLWNTVKSLFHEVNVRRIILKNEEKRVLLEIPIVLGVAGIAFFPWWSAIALIAALVTDCSIMVERVGDKPPAAA